MFYDAQNFFYFMRARLNNAVMSTAGDSNQVGNKKYVTILCTKKELVRT